MSLLVIFAGALAGLGLFVAVSQLLPAPARLDAALARIHGTATMDREAVSLRSNALTQSAPKLAIFTGRAKSLNCPSS